MEQQNRPSALHNLWKMFGFANLPTVSEDEVVGDADEPPEPRPCPSRDPSYSKSPAMTPACRRESLLTRAIMAGTNPPELTLPPSTHHIPRALSTASPQSIPSTAELTSDGDLTSPARSVSPSPPLPATTLPRINLAKPSHDTIPLVIAPNVNDDKPDIASVGEAAVEKSLGRKRCIMFACSDKSALSSKEPSPAFVPKEDSPATPAPRKCRLTFICPTRQDSTHSQKSVHSTTEKDTARPSTSSVNLAAEAAVPNKPATSQPQPIEFAPRSTTTPAFHEFGSSHGETDAWIDEPEPTGPKLTLDDCNRKEIAIRQIAKEAEEEAEAEEQDILEAEGDELDEDQDVEDDFAASDKESDGGNESDNEEGFADSDEESDDGSEYRFWAPVASTAATSTDNLTHFSSRQRSRSSSPGSVDSDSAAGHLSRFSRKSPKHLKMRPSTPELPDSTDFVCGTLDEDRPLEAAFIALREQKKREKHVPIPQDIDPSFPTSDPEDEDDDEEEGQEPSQMSAEPHWMKDQFAGIDEESRGRRTSAFKVSPVHPPVAIKPEVARPATIKRNTNRSPPPRRLFGRSPTRLRSPPPPPAMRYRSPRGSPTHLKMPIGITINRLAQRPSTDRTASLPQTPNPFFRNWKMGSPPTSRIPSGAVTPGVDNDEVRPDLHVRGPVDIVIGLEKKRQKRKEKFWRQHCRKAAKEQAEKRPVPGRGVERMKELGLECAERTRGYGLGQQAKLVLSL